MTEKTTSGQTVDGAVAKGRRIHLVPALVLGISLLLTFVATTALYITALSKDNIRYNAGVARIRNAIESRIVLHLALLQATKGFVDAHQDIDRHHFVDFVGTLELDKNYTGIQGIGYTHIFKASERGALVERMIREGETNFRPYPDSERETLQAILYLVPQNERNKRAIGYDMSSEATRRAAIDRARDTGVAAMSGSVTLVQEITEEKQSGFLIYVPIYREQEVPQTVEARRASIKGFVYAPFRAGNFFSEVQKTLGTEDVGFEVYDSQVAAESILSRRNPEAEQAGDFWATFTSSDEIDVAGRKWVVLYATKPSFGAQSIARWTPVVLLTGLLLSAILFLLTQRQASSRDKIRASAADLLASENERRLLLEKEQEARQLAESASLAKDEFLSVVSHELRTPLNAIAGWTRVLRAAGVSPEMKDAALDKIERNLKLQSILVEDILAFSQMDARTMTIDRELVDLSSVVKSVVSELEPIAAEKGIKIGGHEAGGVVRIVGDGEKLRVAVLKLVSNAIKFTESGGEVEISLEERSDEVRLRVRDTGVGIRQDFLPFVFDRFKQHDSSTTRKFGGLGLGLSICDHLVRMHGGTVSAHSEGEGKGSEFVITLPK